MPTEQVTKDRWEQFLYAFSAHNQTRAISIDVESNEFGPQRIVEGIPLLGIEPDLEDGLNQAILVVAGDTEGAEPDLVRHQVMNPQTIWVKEDEEGRAEAMDIETSDGRTIIQFT